MKNAPIIISIVALLGVVLLFINKMSGDTKNVSDNEINTVNKIAYVNMDTLVGAYNYYNDLQTAFYIKQNEKGAELDSRYRALQRKAYDISNQVRNKMMTPTKAQKMQQGLGEEEQRIMQDKQTYELELAEESQNISLQILDSIKNYVELYNKDKNYNLILTNDTLGKTVIYAEKNMDITNDIIKGLNKRYTTKGTEEVVVK